MKKTSLKMLATSLFTIFSRLQWVFQKRHAA
ncbi:hypothetical protein BpHYR1_049396 [Brachionus plicatilis]|uniref:Uncharacterized protein n=1 Tax=Brachionus plicatilis TaxID=10195 RepID=A0A3M7RDK2_BRAPC|nr:hypothetical protein BpHYR1_049396 [Brachionus plicatilis]